MGVVNVTPDSFYRGSRRLDPDKAVERSLEMARAGADIIDVGGESTRPGAAPVTAEEELHRVEPVISELRRHTHSLISVDTRKAAVAEKALELGADIVNDVSGLVSDSRIAEIVAEAEAGLVLMHMKGTPEHMQEAPVYLDVVGEVTTFLDGAIQRAEASGVAPDSILVDPGIGFGKTATHNLQILNRLGLFASSGKPILIGTSRKTFIGKVLNLSAEDRLFGTAATVVASILHGAHVVRVHDVDEMIQVARMTDAVLNETPEAPPRSARSRSRNE
jgi:dihydropteroate synthase